MIIAFRTAATHFRADLSFAPGWRLSPRKQPEPPFEHFVHSWI